MFEVALQRLVTPAPHALRAVASVPFFIDDPGDPDAEVEAQPEESPLKQARSSSAPSRTATRLHFEIESWARAGGRLSALLYNKLRLAKEVQLNMWSHFCVRAARLAGGRPQGAVTIRTRWVPWD